MLNFLVLAFLAFALLMISKLVEFVWEECFDAEPRRLVVWCLTLSLFSLAVVLSVLQNDRPVNMRQELRSSCFRSEQQADKDFDSRRYISCLLYTSPSPPRPY